MDNYRKLSYELKDSGERQRFASGAVRDIQKGKGRFDLLPFEVFASMNLYEREDMILYRVMLEDIDVFKNTGNVNMLRELAINIQMFMFETDWEYVESLAKHFEAGAAKYGDNNWQLGLPASRYIDSALRHLFKHLDRQTDEPHKVAFAWNILCCLWTCVNKPELNDYKKR